MKKLLIIFILQFLFFPKSFTEIIRIDCEVKISEEPQWANFELDTKAGNYNVRTIGNKIFWETVTEKSGGKWRPIYHTTDRRTGIYVVDFGKVVDFVPKRGDKMVEIVATFTGSCKKATSKNKF